MQKGFSAGDRRLIKSIPQALAQTDHICASVNVGSTKAGINMDAVQMMGEVVKKASEMTADRDCIGSAKIVVFCNAPEDNPFMAGAFHGVGEADCVINVGVSGPGVVRAALEKAPKDLPMNELADLIKRTAFKITRMGQLVAAWRASVCRCLSVSSICHWRRHRRSVIRLLTSSKRWDWRHAALTVRPPVWPC